MPVFDFLKAAASQLIVLHHLALYGPVAEAFDDLLPEVSAWFVEYGRLAVQVFLVLGGFFAVRSLAPAGVGVFVNPLALLWKRYCRLVVPFAVAVGLAAVTASVARLWLSDDMVPDRAGLLQVLAHLLLLHGIVGAESLSAGVWYVAIDFQLFAMMLGLLWLSRRFTVPWAAPFAVALVALASLYFFNRDADWDDWGLYFFGAYALGAFACWGATERRHLSWMLLLVGLGALALMIDFRIRIVIALMTAMLLVAMSRFGWMERWPEIRPVAFLGRISYSVFLIHFPVLLLANAAIDRFSPESAAAILLAGLGAWAASIAAGAVFFRYVENRPLPNGRTLLRVIARLKPGSRTS